MTFTKNNIIFPSKKTYENIQKIDNNLKSLYMLTPVCSSYTFINYSPARNSITKFNHALDIVEKSINKIRKKVKIKEIDDSSFNETFLRISAFFYEAYHNKEIAKKTIKDCYKIKSYNNYLL